MVILAVDDDAEDVEFFSEAVKEIDPSIVVRRAMNGEEALRILESHHPIPDFIFLDINMPLMDGKTCLKAIKQREKLRQIPVIMYSTSSNQSEIRHYEQMGARFLVKPNKFHQLKTSLSGILGYSG